MVRKSIERNVTYILAVCTRQSYGDSLFVFVLILFGKEKLGINRSVSDCNFNKIWYLGCCCKRDYDLRKRAYRYMGYMLMLSHFAMAIQGFLYAPFYRIKNGILQQQLCGRCITMQLIIYFQPNAAIWNYAFVCRGNWLFYVLVKYCCTMYYILLLLT